MDFPPAGALSPKKSLSGIVRLAAALAVGVVAGLVAALMAPWQVIPLLVWDGTALTWGTSLWFHVARMDAVETSLHATDVEPRRATTDAVLLSASVISLVAVVLGIVKAASTKGDEKAVLVAAGILTIVVSWAIVHTLFTLRYAALYYSGTDGGVDFNEDDKPTYGDFAYLSFTIGMTYQVSDTNLTTKEIRHTALRHALLSYLFGTVIIAATINLAAGLAH